MAEYRAIRVEKGSGGFGGPLTIQGTEQKNKVMYITGGGVAPEILNKIVELSGLEPVNGFKTSCPEDQLALVIIDCGGPRSASPQSTSTPSERPARWLSSSKKTSTFPA